MPLQFERVVVEPLAGTGDGAAHPLQPLLQPAAASFEDPHPHCPVGLAEECEVDAEVLVLPGIRAGVGEQLLEALLALGREPVDDLRSLAVERGGRDVRDVRVVLYEETLGHQALQAGVERAVGEGAERAEQDVEPLAQLVPVHRGVVEKAENGELQHSRPPAHAGRLLPHGLSYVGSMYRPDISRTVNRGHRRGKGATRGCDHKMADGGRKATGM